VDSDDSTMSEEFEIFETHFLPFLKEKAELIIPMLEGKKVLEVGCGTGDLLQFLYSDNYELVGSDYSNIYLDKARERNLSIKLFKADLLDDKFWLQYENKFDSVIASEVIEHIQDDSKALKTIFRILKPSGVLVLTVPAFNFLYSNHDKKIGHFRRYSKKSLNNIINSAGFSIETIRYWNILGFFGWLINFKILNKHLDSSAKSSLIYVLTKSLQIERNMKFPLGLTIVVKARKKN